MSFTHGMTKTVRLAILSIATELNKFGKLGVAVIPQDPYYKGSVWQTSATDLERLAKECGAYERFTFAKLINNIAKKGGEDSYLVLNLEYCEAGQKIGNKEDGSPILSKAGKDYYTESFWNVRSQSISISDDVADKLEELTSKIGVELAKDAVNESKAAARAEKKERDIARSAGGNPVTETPVDTGLDTE